MGLGVPDLQRMDRKSLWDLLRGGYPIQASALDDCEYLGVSLGLPGWVDRLAWKTFIKSFHRDPSTGLLRGWNLRLVQRGISGPYELQQRRGEAFSFGHFQVCSLAGYDAPGGLETGLLLDYGRGDNGPWDPVSLLRDPIVALQPGSADLLLGWSWLELGVARLRTPSFFVLERLRPLSLRARPARWQAEPLPGRTGMGAAPLAPCERPPAALSRLGLWRGPQTGNLGRSRSSVCMPAGRLKPSLAQEFAL